MHLPGPFDIVRVVEMEGAFRAPEFLFPEATEEAVRASKVATDPRFYNAETHKLVMSFHTLVIKTPRHNILVDTCIGNDKERPELLDWHQRTGPFLADLATAGVPAESIDFVLCTHLHADHVGWNTKLFDGRWVPTFPNAKYLMARTEVEHWNEVRKTSDKPANHRSWDDSVQPILDAGQALVIDSDYEIEHGIHLIPAPGHTPGNVILHVSDGKERAYLIGDTIHHPLQIEHPDWSSSFCSDPNLSRVTRKEFLNTVAETDSLVMPAHFGTPTAVRITGDSTGYNFETVEKS
ncbi:MAG: MBL fold metallo-hydrolase [Rhodospirillaceae bacterium]|nr:MBL fold metallo-hydrolase [Rhodospirillaceae bacterium]